MSPIRRTLLGGAATALLALGLLAAPALAATSTATMTAPPTPMLSPVPVQACIGGDCEDTPDLATVSLVVTATVTKSSLAPPPPPLILPVACPGDASEGTALAIVMTESGKLGVSANLIGTLANGQPYLETLDPESIDSSSGGAILVSACTVDDGDQGHGDRDHRDRDHGDR
jgi:hypothetical protein